VELDPPSAMVRIFDVATVSSFPVPRAANLFFNFALFSFRQQLWAEESYFYFYKNTSEVENHVRK
jgi:hypothetical protein